MEPKVAAIADFVEKTPHAVGVIGAAAEIAAILAGTSGTRIVADVPAATGTETTTEPATDAVLFAVNGTLMRGLKLNPNLVDAGATFVREAATEPAYRLWTIGDEHPAMVRVTDGSGVGGGRRGVVGSAPGTCRASCWPNPPDCRWARCDSTTGRWCSASSANPPLSKGQREITGYGGWRAYAAERGLPS